MQTNTISKRIAALRSFMKTRKIDAFIIPSTDPHQSEYVADYWKLRTYFSGFTGSAGTLVVTENKAALWTDSRYFLQFEDECANTEIELCKQSIPHAPEHVGWLANLLDVKAIVGLDYRQFSKSQIDYIKTVFKEKEITLQNEPHFAKNIWLNRPSLPNRYVEIHAEEFSGESTSSKINKVKNELKKHNANYYFFSSLDEIAWLFNIRANDVDFTPLVTAYALIGVEKSVLFCDLDRFTSESIQWFEQINIEIKNYDDVVHYLPKLSENKIVITDENSLNYASYKAIKGQVIFASSVVQNLKSIKNDVEIAGEKNCMYKDGIALTKFFIWLEKELQKRSISEYEIGKKIAFFRNEQEYYVGESFAAIVGYKGNGAIIHYTAPEENSAEVTNEGILLLDSGAQYKNGTTDITRTIWLGGTPTKEIKTAYTAVLKGYVALERLEFPEKTTGVQIDVLARMFLWQNGLNYPHGTGHGIGSFGMVHEPTQGFATSVTTLRGSSSHYANQFTTIEPGCYVENEFGIRIENVVLSEVNKETTFGKFLKFIPLTLCYIDKQLIDFNMLTQEEKEWLNSYHEKVYKELSSGLNKEEQNWLLKKCEAI